MKAEKRSKPRRAPQAPRRTASHRAPGSAAGSAPGSAPGSKEEIYRRVLEGALRLDFSRGHLRWRITDLARASGITRTLIYYYFGTSKAALIQGAARALGEDFFGLREDRQELWKQGKILESIRQTRALAQSMPHLVHLYLAQRNPGAPLYDQLRELERRYSDNLRRHFPHAKPERIAMAFAMLFGVVTLSDLSDQAFCEAVTHILSLLQPG